MKRLPDAVACFLIIFTVIVILTSGHISAKLWTNPAYPFWYSTLAQAIVVIGAFYALRWTMKTFLSLVRRSHS